MTQAPMRMYQLFARIKEATPELEGGKGHMLRLRKELYDMLRYIIKQRREIPLENDNVETMYEKSLKITRYLHDHKKDLHANYEQNFLYLLAIATEALGKDISNDDVELTTRGVAGQGKNTKWGWLKKAGMWTLQWSAFAALNAIVLKHVLCGSA